MNDNGINNNNNTIDIYVNPYSELVPFVNTPPELYINLNDDKYMNLFKVAVCENVKANDTNYVHHFNNMSKDEWWNIYLFISNKIDKHTLSTLQYIAYYRKCEDVFRPYADSTLYYKEYQFNDWLKIKVLKNIVLPYPYPKIYRCEILDTDKELSARLKIPPHYKIEKVVSVSFPLEISYALSIKYIIRIAKPTTYGLLEYHVLESWTEESMYIGKMVVIGVSRYGKSKKVRVYDTYNPLNPLEKQLMKYHEFRFNVV